MADCMSVFCGARSSTDTLRSQKNQPIEKQKDQPVNTDCTKDLQPETSPGVKADLTNDLSPTGQVSAESLQRNWEQLKKQQQLVEKEMHAQEEIKEKQVEKLRQLQMTLDNVHRRQSYQDSPSPRLIQEAGTDGNDHHLQQHPSLQNLHPQRVNRTSVQQPPDLLPQHKSLPQVHQRLIAPLPPPSDPLSQMRQQHFERLQQMQQQIRHQQQHCMQMIPPPLLPLQPPLQPLLQPGLPSCHQMQMKHLQQMQNMQQHLNQLHSMSHDSLMRRAGGVDLMKPSQSEMLVVSNEESHMSQTQQELRHSQGEVRTETSRTEYSLNHIATIEDEPNHFRKPGTPLSTFEHPHSNSPHYGCYSNVDLSNPFPVPVDSKQRPYSVYEGFYSPSPEPWHEDSHLYQTHSSSDIDMPSLEESDISGSLSDLLAAGQSCSNLSTSEATELQFSDSEDENKSHYDSLPHQDVIMDDEVCVSDDAVGRGAYVRRNSCPDVFVDHTCDRHSFNSDFSGSSDYSEDNTSEITDTYSHSLESSCTEEANDLNPESDVVPDFEQVITPVERQQKYIDHDEKIDRVSQVIELSKTGSWSELSKSAITALLEEMDDSDGTEEEDENSIGSLLDSYQDDANVPNGDIILDVDVIEETDYDGDTDTFERKPINFEKDEKSDSSNNVNNNDVEEDDDDATLTGDSSSDCDSDVMKTVIRRENKKDIGADPGAEAIYSPVIKRRGICEAEIASSQTSLSSVSHPKMPTVLQQQQPFKAKSTTWAMSCLRPCPPIRPSNLVRDDATKSPRIGRKSSVTRRKPVEDVKTLEDDAHLLKVIEAYCTSAKTRQTVNSSLLDSPQMLIAEEEKIIVEEVKGNQTVVEEKTLVDTVYSLKDQVKELRTEHKRMRKDLEDEKRARKRLEGLLRKSLRSLVETSWEEGANTS